MNNLKIAFRLFLRQRVVTIINITGLSLSMALCLLTVLFVQYEYSFEKHNPDAVNIFRLLNTQQSDRYPVHAIASFNQLTDAVPELKNGTMVQLNRNYYFEIDKQNIEFNNVIITDNNFFSLFKVKMLEGEASPLTDEASAVISESEARRLFPSSQAVGKTIRYENRFDFHIKGVFADAPVTSIYRPDVIINIHAKKTLENFEYTSLYNQSTCFYFQLPENANLSSIEQKILKQSKIIYETSLKDRGFQLQPLTDIHLKSSDTIWDTIERSSEDTVKLFILVALLVLLIAIVNFVNLAVALENKRSFNTGLQKTMGAGRQNIIYYLLTETSILATFCLLLTVIITKIALPHFNSLMGTEIGFSITNRALWATIAIIAIIMIAVPTLSMFRGQMKVSPSVTIQSKGRSLPRKGSITSSQILTIAQIAVSIGLIIGVTAINKQFTLLMDKKLGFDKSNLVSIDNPWNERVVARHTLFKQELDKLPFISGLTATWNTPGHHLSNAGALKYDESDKNNTITCWQSPTDGNFFDIMRTKFIMGGPYSPTDSTKAVINEQCLKSMNVENPIGMKVTNLFNNSSYEICGVIEDIQNRSLRNDNQPSIYYLTRELGKFIVRIEPSNLNESINILEDVWKKIEPVHPFILRFVGDDIKANYKREIRSQELLVAMSVLAIFISMLGLYGLSIQLIMQRTKEIGIRKVNGATITEILTMLNKHIVYWVLIAFIVAVPVTYYAMSRWLENFAYKTTLSWWIFALAGIASLLVALLTVSWQSWRAATRNPVESLRYE